MQGREGRPPAELQEQSCETRGAVLTDTMALQPPPGWSVHLVTFSNTSKLGFELTQDREGVRIASVEEGGAAALSRRVFVGDRVASVNGVQPAAAGLPHPSHRGADQGHSGVGESRERTLCSLSPDLGEVRRHWPN